MAPKELFLLTGLTRAGCGSDYTQIVSGHTLHGEVPVVDAVISLEVTWDTTDCDDGQQACVFSESDGSFRARFDPPEGCRDGVDEVIWVYAEGYYIDDCDDEEDTTYGEDPYDTSHICQLHRCDEEAAEDEGACATSERYAAAVARCE